MFSHDIPRDPIVNPADDLPHDPELLGSNIPSGNINRLVVGIRGAEFYVPAGVVDEPLYARATPLIERGVHVSVESGSVFGVWHE